MPTVFSVIFITATIIILAVIVIVVTAIVTIKCALRKRILEEENKSDG